MVMSRKRRNLLSKKRKNGKRNTKRNTKTHKNIRKMRGGMNESEADDLINQLIIGTIFSIKINNNIDRYKVFNISRNMQFINDPNENVYLLKPVILNNAHNYIEYGINDNNRIEYSKKFLKSTALGADDNIIIIQQGAADIIQN